MLLLDFKQGVRDHYSTFDCDVFSDSISLPLYVERVHPLRFSRSVFNRCEVSLKTRLSVGLENAFVHLLKTSAWFCMECDNIPIRNKLFEFFKIHDELV